MSAVHNTFRVSTATHGGVTFADTIGGGIDEQMGWVDSMPGTRISPATAPDSFSYSAQVDCSQRFTPVVRGTKATLTFTLLEMDSATTGTVAAAGALAGEYHADFNSKPHKHSQHFKYDAGGSENIAPISFT